MTDEEKALKHAQNVKASADEARRIAALRSASSKVAVKLLKRGATAAHAGTPETWLEDNMAPTHRAPGRSIRDALIESLAPLATDGMIGSVLSNVLSSLLLAAHDEEFKCEVERLPPPAVSFERSLAHVEALGAGIKPDTAARVARRLTMVLMNYSGERRPIVVRAEEREEQPSAPQDELATQHSQAPGDEEAAFASPAASAGRQVRGYAKLKEALSWADATAMPAGTVLEVLSPNERDRDDVQRGERSGSPVVIVWFESRARVIPRSSLQSAKRSEWNAWMRENQGK